MGVYFSFYKIRKENMRKQFIVTESDKSKREEFYDYIISKYKLDICYPYDKNRFIESNFPFVIDFKENSIWICNSITSLACASQSGKIITIDDFMKYSN